MAFILNYQTLTQAVQAYLERNDATLVSQIPLFMMLGQRRIARELKILGVKNVIEDNLVVGESLIIKPANWLNDSSFNIGIGAGFNTTVFLQQRSYEWCATYWPSVVNQGQPKYYASDWNQDYWFLVPTPDKEYSYEVTYFEIPNLIDENINTNFWTGSAPEVLLYATLLETAIYVKDDDRIASWSTYYENAKKALTEEDIRRIYDAYSKRGA